MGTLRFGTVVTGIGAALASALLLIGLAPAAGAAPGNPGVPGAPTTVFEEDFENVTNPAAAELLADYTGAPPTSMTYTAHPDWLEDAACNGVIASWNATTTAGDCDQGIYDGFVRPIARGMGAVLGGGDDDQVMSDVTISGFPAAATPAATLQTIGSIPLTSSNRFITFSIDAGAVSCDPTQAHPLLRFFLLDDSDEIPVSNNAINACTDPRGATIPPGETGEGVRVGSYASDASILFSGSSLGLKVTNDQTSGDGNDYAVDNLRVLDATPQLDKEFTDPRTVSGRPATLTFTITNTSDLAAKEGWSFTDELPAGLKIAKPASVNTDCANSTVTAPARGKTITVTGDLQANEPSCEVNVDVVSSSRGTFENCAANISAAVGLDLPGCAGLRVVGKPRLAVNKRTETATARPGEVVAYRITVRNKGTVDARRVRVCDELPAGQKLLSAPGADNSSAKKVCWAIKRLRAGAKRTFRIVTQIKFSARLGEQRNKAIVKGRNAKRNADVAAVGVVSGTRPCPDVGSALARC